jgi:hypothetical protein
MYHHYNIVYNKAAFRCLSLCMLRSLKLPNGFWCGFLIDRVIQEKGLHVNNMHNIVKKHFSLNIATVRSRGRSLVTNKNN